MNDREKAIKIISDTIRASIIEESGRNCFFTNVNFYRDIDFLNFLNPGKDVNNEEMQFYRDICKLFEDYNCKFHLEINDRSEYEEVVFQLNW